MSTKLHVYETADVTVTYDATRCIHNGHCVVHLPAVFDKSARPCVQPERADAADVLAIVAGCIRKPVCDNSHRTAGWRETPALSDESPRH